MPEESLNNPHDRFFKQAFGRRNAAEGFFQEYLPSGLAERLDWRRLERQDGMFVDESLRERHTDLLFTVPWSDRELILYCLFEHQSSKDRWMALRLLGYMVRIWEDQLRREPGRESLSPILPIVLHQSEDAWNGSQRFSSLIDTPEDADDVLAGFIPNFTFHLVDLAEWPTEELRGSVLVRAILATMKAARSAELVARLEELAPLLSGALRENDLGFVRVCLEYLMRGSDEVDLRVFRTMVGELKIGEIKEEVMTLADQLIQEGRKEGRREEGRNILRRQLTRRFGTLPDWATERLANASTDQLEKWSVRILDAPTLEAVFSG